MDTDLAGKKGGISERFAPDEDPGRLIEAEHVARYRWAAQAAKGRVVLDAGCGTAYGTKMLAEAGAREVVGIDIAEGVLQAVEAAMPETVRLDSGDLRDLPYEEDTFDLVVCFEVIEHFEDPFSVLDGLVRVLSPGGVLLISSPNRGVYPEGNPHHYHEFRPDELAAELGSRLANVRLLRQHDYLVSALLSEESFFRSAEPLEELDVHKLVGGDRDTETYTLAVASNDALPNLRQVLAMTGTLELRDWLSLFEKQTAALRLRADQVEELEARVQQSDRLGELLVDAEQRMASVPDLELRITDLERELDRARRSTEAALEQARVLDERVMRGQRVLADVFNSPSWRLTKPLRVAKHLLLRD